jgi:hypothetical protein
MVGPVVRNGRDITLYKRGRHYWIRFKWNGILIRERTRAEDLATAKKILRNRGSKLAIEQERHLRIGGAEKRQMRFKGILRA